METQIYYDAWDLSCKRPFGALKNGEAVTLTLRVADCLGAHGAAVVVRSDGADNGRRIVMSPNGITNHFSIYEIRFSVEQTGLWFYRFEIEIDTGILFVGRGEHACAAIGDFLPEWQLTVYDSQFDTPNWPGNGLLYQIFPDRFFRAERAPLPETKNRRQVHTDWRERPLFTGDDPAYEATDFYGGSLRGILEKLPFLQTLGVTAIYLNPIFEAAANHRYNTADYYRIDPYLGEEADFTELCSKARALGIAVILDGVFSHTGSDSVYFNKDGHYPSLGAWQSSSSPYASWYRFSSDRKTYECWWNFPTLPNVNEEDPGYLDFICGEQGVLRYWMRAGASGWRLDVVDELPDGFLCAVRQAVKAENPEAYLLGEVWEDASTKESYGARRPYLLGGQLDSVMNYPWRAAILDFVRDGKTDEFYAAVMELLDHYPLPAIRTLMNPLSTHDTPRAMTVLGVDHPVDPAQQGDYLLTPEEYQAGASRLRIAAVIQYTLPGFPSLYYGDEAGAFGFADPWNRRCYPWGEEDPELLAFFASLGRMRLEHAGRFAGSMRFFQLAPGQVAYLRGEDLLIAANVSDKPMQVAACAEQILVQTGEIDCSDKMVCLAPDSAVVFLRSLSPEVYI